MFASHVVHHSLGSDSWIAPVFSKYPIQHWNELHAGALSMLLPALLTSTSMLIPSRSSLSKSALTDSSEVTSVTCTRTLGDPLSCGSARISLRADSSSGCERAVMTMFDAPANANACATA